MIEIRIHGRGGQGNVVAAYLLATAAFHQGMSCQAFPSFGAERRGAPVAAFVRLDHQPILRRDQVKTPAFLIIQDPSLLHLPDVIGGLHGAGGILVNSPEDAAVWEERTGHSVLAFPAARMAQETLGRPVPNVALLAAFLSATQLLPLPALTQALESRFTGKVLEKNRQLVDAAAAAVPAGHWKERLDAAAA